MLTIRLFATDLDGTLFDHDLRLGDRTRRAVRSLEERGVAFVIATGRMFQATLPFAQALGVTTPLITYQGALIRDPRTGVDVWHRTLGAALALEALGALEATGLHINLYLNDELFLKALTPEAASYLALARVEPHLVEDWGQAIATHGEPTKIVAIGPEPEILRQVAAFQARFGDRLFVVQSQPTFLEIALAGVSKGAALAEVAASLGVPREQVAAVGDGMNDLEMLTWAGLGVAMGNAKPAVQAQAQRVTGSVHDEGVALLIEQLCAEGAM